MTDAPLHPEVEALVIGTPTCRHGNFTEQDLRRIALLAASKAREDQREVDAKVCEALEIKWHDEDWQGGCMDAAAEIEEAIRRGTP